MTDKVALITGASRGLGRSIAVHLATAGVGVVGTFNNAGNAKEVEAEIAAANGRCIMLHLDLGESSSFGRFKSTLQERLRDEFNRSEFDYLVNNAGISNLGPYMETSEQQFDELVRVNLKGPFFLSQALIPIIARGGRILHVSTAATRFVLENHCAYAAVKSGVDTMTSYMAKELGDRRITVNVIAPGAVETDFAGGAVRDNAELNKIFADMTPLGRTGKPNDIGSAVTGLLSSNFEWLNGQRIELTGGQSL